MRSFTTDEPNDDDQATPLPQVDPADEASFKDLKGRVFTLRLPYSVFTALRLELNIDFREKLVLKSLEEALDDSEVLYNIIAFLVSSQLQAHGLTFESWQDDMFGCDETADEDIATPLEAAGAALVAVTTGFIRSHAKRRVVRNKLKLMLQSLNAMYDKSGDELDSVSPSQIGDLVMTQINGGKTLQERMEKAASTILSGPAPDDSESSPGDTPSVSS